MEGLGPQEQVTGGTLPQLKMGLRLGRCRLKKHLLKWAAGPGAGWQVASFYCGYLCLPHAPDVRLEYLPCRRQSGWTVWPQPCFPLLRQVVSGLALQVPL